MLTRIIPLLVSISAFSFPIYGQIAHAKVISVPSYPELPKIANIQGLVQLDLSIENGRVVSIKPISGPVQLAKGSALKRVLDWEFETTCPKTITLYIEFILQPYDGNKFYGGTEGSIIELKYPNFIKITSKVNPPVEQLLAIYQPPNLSFNPGPTVRIFRHALVVRLTVGPVNFIRQALHMDDPFVYDKAKYHFDSVNEAGLPEAHAYHHTAFFFRWLIENNLMSEFFISECSEPLQAMKSGESSIIDIYEWWDCCLISDMLSDRGNAFARSYFDFDHGQYLSDYAKVLQKDLPSEFHVEYTEANYQAIKSVIDSRYCQWQQPINNPWWKFWAQRLTSRSTRTQPCVPSVML